MSESWLVTGGAGYIGAHVARALQHAGLRPVVVDDLSSGRDAFVPEGIAFYRGSVLDRRLLVDAITSQSVQGVIHLAGYKYAGESVRRPVHTYQQNVTAAATLLDAMRETGVGLLVNSSSAAVYGTPHVELVDEATPTVPESPYGESKLVAEWLIRDQAVATGLRHTSLRYFNVVGAGYPDVWDSSPHNLFPLLFQALSEGRAPRINGDDYPTPDGTCVRDYVHVVDIADAHLRAARALSAGQPLRPVYNLGSGTGVSVREVIDMVADVTAIPISAEIGPRRAGDPARIVASARLAADELGWSATRDLREMVRSAWASVPGEEPSR